MAVLVAREVRAHDHALPARVRGEDVLHTAGPEFHRRGEERHYAVDS